MFGFNGGGPADIVIRTVCVYFFLLIGVRLSGKREIGQLMPFDFILLLVLSNAVQNAMVGPDNSLSGGMLAAAVLLMLTISLNFLGRHAPWIRRILVGAPTIIVWHGTVMHRNMEKEHLTSEELHQIMREHEVSQISDIELATLEVDGNISVIRRQDNDHEPKFVKTRRRMRRQRISN